MIDVPAQIKNDYGKLIPKRGIPIHNHNFYQKWILRYLLTKDFFKTLPFFIGIGGLSGIIEIPVPL